MAKKALILIFPILIIAIAAVYSNKSVQTEYSIDTLKGAYNPAQNPDFATLPPAASLKQNLYLQKPVIDAFLKMAAEAAKSGVNLYILSATRSFEAQKNIWESKFTGRRLVDGKDLSAHLPNEKERAVYILQYSSAPGTSRHHWGTDFDIAFAKSNPSAMLDNASYTYGAGLRAYEWMSANAARFGFCQPYKETPKERSGDGGDKKGYKRGYEEEKWHWSYAPLASLMLESFLRQREALEPANFAGAQAVQDLYLDYVQNIHADCASAANY